jgi:hypothetical protein
MKMKTAGLLCSVMLFPILLFSQGRTGAPVGPNASTRTITETREFESNANITVPDGVNKIMVEVWGAGGGGSASGGFINALGNQATASGAGGGSGAYARYFVDVIPGQTIAIIAGAAGTAGIASTGVTDSINGGDGGASIVSVGSMTVSAAGGKGGHAASPPGLTGGAGTGGAGGTRAANAGIARAGLPGGNRTFATTNTSLLHDPVVGASGGVPIFLEGTIAPLGSFGGAGGDYLGNPPETFFHINGYPGGGGYVLISW